MLADIKHAAHAAVTSYLLVVLIAFLATGAWAQQAGQVPVQATVCPPGQDCLKARIPPKERKIDTGKKQCGWATINGKKEPLFDCGGAK